MQDTGPCASTPPPMPLRTCGRGAIQIVSPAPFRGHRVRLSAAGRTDNVGAAGIWLRVEGQLNGAPAVLAFDNMLGGERAVTGTTGWLTFEVVLDVPLDATAPRVRRRSWPGEADSGSINYASRKWLRQCQPLVSCRNPR